MLLLLLLGQAAIAQQESRVYIKLANSPDLNIEKRRFFDQEGNYSIADKTDSQLSFQFNKGKTLPEGEDFNVKKVGNDSYLLKIKSAQPEMVYLNYKPIYIVPGDSVKITFKELLRTFDTRQDTIIAEGKLKCNYEFSYFLKSKKLEGSYPKVTSAKYQGKILSFCTDLKKYYADYDLYYSSVAGLKLCDPNLIAYLHRKNQETYLFNLIRYESDFKAQKKLADAKAVGDILEESFNKTKFVAADSLLSFGMENLFKRYFKRLTGLRYNELASKDDYFAFKSFIQAYPNPFVKEYFIYFLVANYSDTIKNYDPEAVAALKKDISNAQILNGLKKLNL
ncbi:hypothetical protein [Pedobacter rhodius]|uniref:DUF3857 domain-containing protein n=1 Tax=Pedobacter rhodius TaxID=3004098 RepID=A0ABT4KZT6_9SPHI|nr:hypothetical protein [Pedobacter sp. SJ11]MCZ4224448.1 hypothetical protein [Pedobacter sp. SJ11]